MKRKTIKSLMSTKKIVYVKLSTEWVVEAFFALAKFEGFTLDKDLIQKDIPQNCFVTHAESEFNLATPQELFSYCEAIISLCTNVQNLVKIFCIYYERESQKPTRL